MPTGYESVKIKKNVKQIMLLTRILKRVIFEWLSNNKKKSSPGSEFEPGSPNIIACPVIRVGGANESAPEHRQTLMQETILSP